MRPLEILIPILLALYLIWPLTGRMRPQPVKLLPAFTLAVILIHAIIEGLRWQMYPLYAFAVIALLMSISSLSNTQNGTRSTVQPLRIFLSLGLLAISTTLPILLPVPNIPAPSGPYQVGTRIYELTDTSRKELYSGKDEARRFQIQVWYPADVTSTDERAPWLEHADIFTPAIAEFFELPPFFLDHLSLVNIPVYKEAETVATDKGFPVILFSHGWDGYAAQNTSQALELVSHGFVVVGIQHTYGAVVTTFEDGTIAKNNPLALPSGAPDEEYGIAARLLGDQWAGDMSYALDFLTEQNDDSNSPLYKALDLSHTGAYGHSTGGGAAIQFCGTDARCKALLGLDPFMRPVSINVMESGVMQPSVFMFSQTWSSDLNKRLFASFHANSTDIYGAVNIKGTAHYDFTDLPLLSPVASQIGLKGPIKAKRVMAIINNYLLPFFDMTLKGQATDLFEGPSIYPEIDLLYR